MTAEHQRLEEDAQRKHNWTRWGPYLAERQWATVREDYSANSDSWNYFPHDHARSRVYRWGEDGLLGFTDRECRLCFAVALWNGQDRILKERLFGLSGPQGNHGEDVKEEYYYLAATPTYSYAKALYKYPQKPFPYDALVQENQRRGLQDREYELVDTGIFSENEYFDVFAEYAKAGPDDILIRLRVINRAAHEAQLTLLPTLWFRNAWTWGCSHSGCYSEPKIKLEAPGKIVTDHETLGRMVFLFPSDAQALFTNNETNTERVYKYPNPKRFVKDAFHDYVINGAKEAVNPGGFGTKSALLFQKTLGPQEQWQINLRICSIETPVDAEQIFNDRIKEYREFVDTLHAGCDPDERAVAEQAAAGLLWSRQFYHYVVYDWLAGDPNEPKPPEERWQGRNRSWLQVYARDVISMPDCWEYPWFAVWDLAFHVVAFAKMDPQFAKSQLQLLLREWYMHPNGQLPAYEYEFSAVNPPVHAWAAWRVYKISAARGQRDLAFLESAFHKLLMNFTWWVNRKDTEGNNIFSGGFLGLDNIGVFDRSQPLPTGGYLQQADGTAWMGFYCLMMLSIALELAQTNHVYEDMASKFFEHFVAISDSINTLGGAGLWDSEDGFFYDRLKMDGHSIPLKTRSLVGLMPLIAVVILERENIDQLPGFKKRMQWFLDYRPDLQKLVTFGSNSSRNRVMLALPARERLERMLGFLLNEAEFLSPFGIRSLSKIHQEHPYDYYLNGQDYRVAYAPGESDSRSFGGNSNWRGPIWFPINFLIIEALQRYHYFFGNELQVEFPTGSKERVTLDIVASQLAHRVVSIFLPDEKGARPCHGTDLRYRDNPAWKDLVLFYEYFHGDTGRGCGASHQTGWTGLVLKLLRK
jgi:Glycosyl hydrolase family 63 C-terminal domain